jgi:hypothetical protein
MKFRLSRQLSLFSFFFAVSCCAIEKPKDFIALYLEVVASQSESKSYSIRDSTTGEIITGVHDKKPIIASTQIQRIELAVQEFNIRPTLGVCISFQKSADVGIKSIRDNARIIVYLGGECRAVIPARLLKDTIEQSSSLFIALPKTTEAERRKIEEQIQEINKTK